MPRTAPPPWVRWVGQDGRALCRRVHDTLDDLWDGLRDGDRLDETLTKARTAKKEVYALQERLAALQAGITVQDLINWIRQDPDLETMVRAVLEGATNE